MKTTILNLQNACKTVQLLQSVSPSINRSVNQIQTEKMPQVPCFGFLQRHSALLLNVH